MNTSRCEFEEPVLTGVTVDAEGAKLERVYPSAIGDLFPDDELRISARLVASDAGGKGKIILRGTSGGVQKSFEVPFDLTVADAGSSATLAHPWAGRLWALSRVDDVLGDIRAKGESDERKNEAIELGLTYNLVTPYTSFLAIPENEETANARDVLSSARDRKRKLLAQSGDAAALSRWNMPPGDPILKVRAPRDAQRVTAAFPFGLVTDLAYDDFSESWMTRFLVPANVTDGTYEVRVTIVDAYGAMSIARVAYTIDSTEPAFQVDVKTEGDLVSVRVLSDEPLREARMIAVSEPGRAVVLTNRGDGRTFEGTIRAPRQGSFDLRVVVADSAHNESDRTVHVDVTR
ncbi:MAG TPA: hypothetical protein VNO21_13055 [Polyangiaceae bacterium]|nr:hypothetical protein [Polyangiaceae bacterium]